MYSVSQIRASGANPILYQHFLNPVITYRDAERGNLGLKVLLTQTGGKIMGPGNDLISQMNWCVEDASRFYHISFDPPTAKHADEFHELKGVVDRPGVVVRTNMGYYNEPVN
ncbi:MAG: hypothetical protein JST28_13105 [Acidobacteria bacterium]|nr:hypothetical protein [Acidobacteriota bacterium]